MLLIWLSVFVGVLISQLLYIGVNWLQYKRKDYASYFLYVLLLLIYFILIHQEAFVFGIKQNEPNYLNARFFLRPVAFAIYVFYFEFVIRFLETATKFSKLHRYIKFARNMLIFFCVFFLVLNIFANDSYFANIIYHVFNLVIFVASITLLFLLWKIHTLLSKFILRGATAALMGASVSNLLNSFNLQAIVGPLESLMIFVAIGVLIEFYFFNSGLSYKSRQVELDMIESQQNLIDELEKSKALEIRLGNIRQKISRDLHDELGATLSGITMYSYITKSQLQNQDYVAVSNSLKVIKENAKEMVAKLNDIVWEVNPVEDQLSALLVRLKEFALQLTVVKQIKLDFSFPDTVALLRLPMEYRRNIYMICKETINNAVKYSEANLLQINVCQTDFLITIVIADNGKGFDFNKATMGNGLINMRKRADEINAELEISSSINNGTKISLNCKIT